MQVIECQQGTKEWFQARLGIPTASNFGKIVTPAKLEYSRQSCTYMNKLLAEWLSGEPDAGFENEWTQRGIEMEQEAIDLYAMLMDVEPAKVGFIRCDSFGCSPDALIGDDGGLEVKCPSQGVHVSYLLSGSVPREYYMQVLGSLLVTGRDWWDFFSYCPGLPHFMIRTHADESRGHLQALANGISTFNKEMEVARKSLIEKGYQPS